MDDDGGSDDDNDEEGDDADCDAISTVGGITSLFTFFVREGWSLFSVHALLFSLLSSFLFPLFFLFFSCITFFFTLIV